MTARNACFGPSDVARAGRHIVRASLPAAVDEDPTGSVVAPVAGHPAMTGADGDPAAGYPYIAAVLPAPVAVGPEIAVVARRRRTTVVAMRRRRTVRAVGMRRRPAGAGTLVGRRRRRALRDGRPERQGKDGRAQREQGVAAVHGIRGGWAGGRDGLHHSAAWARALRHRLRLLLNVVTACCGGNGASVATARPEEVLAERKESVKNADSAVSLRYACCLYATVKTVTHRNGTLNPIKKTPSRGQKKPLKQILISDGHCYYF